MRCIRCNRTSNASDCNNLQCPYCGGNMIDTAEQFACMVRARYHNYYGPEVWITHSVSDTLAEARAKQTEYETSRGLLPGHGTTVVVYHSREWDALVR